jgi:hypothetical protein
MHGVAAAGHAVEAYRRIELRQFRLKLLVDRSSALSAPRMSPLQLATI